MTRPDPSLPARPEEATLLPPGLDLLWGRRRRGRRGPKPGLSVDAIVEAAIRVADADGLEGVSMARVAAEVDFTTMSLYRYVASKEELLQLMWNASAQGAETLSLTGDDWRCRLRQWAELQRAALDQHPWLTQMPLAAPPVAPNSLIFVERGLETLDGTGLADEEKLGVIGLLSSYTLSEARMANDARRAAAALAEGAPGRAWTFEALLRELVDEDRFPRLYRIAWSDRGEDGPDGSEEYEGFLWGIERILDSVQVLMDRPAQARPAAEADQA